MQIYFSENKKGRKYIYTKYIYSTKRKNYSFCKYLMVILWLSYGYPVVGYAKSTLIL